MIRRVWGFLSSIKLALGLILVLCGMGLAGVFIHELDVFHSWWFFSTGALLILNIVFCNVRQWGHIRSIFRKDPVISKDSFYQTGNDYLEITTVISPADTSKILGSLLRRRGYRVSMVNAGDNIHLSAEKNRYFQLGTYISHISLVLILLAFLLGGTLGFRDADFIVAEENTRQVGHNTGLSLQLLSFTDEYYPDNMPKDYRSQVILYDNGREARQAVIRVNRPLEYKGIRIIQMAFGSAVQVQIKQTSAVLFHEILPQLNVVEREGIQRYVNTIDLPGDGLVIELISPALNVNDTIIPIGYIAVNVSRDGNDGNIELLKKGVPQIVNGIEITYQADRKYSHFQVSRNPGNVLIWISSSLYLLGLVFTLYFPFRSARILSQTRSPAGGRVFIRFGTTRGMNKPELKILLKDIEKDFPVDSISQISEEN